MVYLSSRCYNFVLQKFVTDIQMELDSLINAKQEQLPFTSNLKKIQVSIIKAAIKTGVLYICIRGKQHEIYIKEPSIVENNAFFLSKVIFQEFSEFLLFYLFSRSVAKLARETFLIRAKKDSTRLTTSFIKLCYSSILDRTFF